MALWTPKAHLLWCTSSSKAPGTNSCIPSPNRATNWDETMRAYRAPNWEWASGNHFSSRPPVNVHNLISYSFSIWCSNSEHQQCFRFLVFPICKFRNWKHISLRTPWRETAVVTWTALVSRNFLLNIRTLEMPWSRGVQVSARSSLRSEGTGEGKHCRVVLFCSNFLGG